jgi:hypothetical protein
LREVDPTLRHWRYGNAVAIAEILRPDEARVDREARAIEAGVGEAVTEEIKLIELRRR